jgi:enoyl-CoA hydratase
MNAQLDRWACDTAVKAVVVHGAGERAFCAGGDIRALYKSGQTGTPYALDFYCGEYILNATIKHYPKPYMALMSGIVMGGGVGVSVHGYYRVADETTTFAMPETGIGLFPDVGGSYFLPRCPGETGMYVALTGARLKAADLHYAGIATDFANHDRRDDLIRALASGNSVGNLMSEFTGYVVGTDVWEKSALETHRSTIDAAFSAPSVEEILERLYHEESDWAQDTAKNIRAKSPTSLKITFRQIREGKRLDFDECMKMEYRMVNRIVAGHDFYEGVRATIVDKDGAPNWRPADLSGVTNADVDAYFAPLGDKELKL